MQEKARNNVIIMYGTPVCPMVPPMKAMLNRSRVNYEYINILQNLSAREHVREINNGYESVPTFVFPDDSTLTEPGAGEMRQKLKELGYEVPLSAMIAGNLQIMVMIVVIIFALLRGFGVF